MARPLLEREGEGIMKVAIPVFGPRVSPRFDFAPGILVFTLEDGKVLEREEISLRPWNPWQRVEKLKELQVQTLICGGIDGISERILLQHRIQVIPWIAGEAEAALEAFLEGKLEPGVAVHLGFCRKRDRREKVSLRRGKIQG